MKNTISLVLVAYKSNIPMLEQALNCGDLFDEVILHINDEKTLETILSIPPNTNLKIVYRPDQISVPDALNEAIAMAQSDYIIPFTDDDYFYRKNLDSMIAILKSLPNDVEVFHYPINAGNEEEMHTWGTVYPVTFDILWEENVIPFSCIYHKKIWTAIGGYKNVPFSDWLFWLEVVKRNYKLEYVRFPMYMHRCDHKISLANLESQRYSIGEIKELFKKELDKHVQN